MSVGREVRARVERERREEEQVLRRLRSWSDRGGRTVTQLVAGLEWPGGAVGVGAVLRRLLDGELAHERDGAWFPGPAVRGQSETTSGGEHSSDGAVPAPWTRWGQGLSDEDLDDRSSAAVEVVTGPGLETAGRPSSTTGTTPNGAGERDRQVVGGERASSPDPGPAAGRELLEHHQVEEVVVEGSYAERVKARRAELGLTQGQLAVRAGAGWWQSRVSQVERGELELGEADRAHLDALLWGAPPPGRGRGGARVG